jgi:hypothetical protein
MSSLRKSEAARINGAKSRGPKTPEGKAISSQNALTHGMCAKALVLTNENVAHFEEVRRQYLDQLKPVGIIEADLVDELIAARWRQRRGWAVETAMIDLKQDQQEAELAIKYNRLDEPTRTVIALHTIGHESNALNQIQRHDSRLSRQFRLTMKTLLELQERRKKQEPAPEPIKPGQLKPVVPFPTPAPVAEPKNDANLVDPSDKIDVSQ